MTAWTRGLSRLRSSTKRGNASCAAGRRSVHGDLSTLDVVLAPRLGGQIAVDTSVDLPRAGVPAFVEDRKRPHPRVQAVIRGRANIMGWTSIRKSSAARRRLSRRAMRWRPGFATAACGSARHACAGADLMKLNDSGPVVLLLPMGAPALVAGVNSKPTWC